MFGRRSIGVRFGSAVAAILFLYASTVWAIPHAMSDEELDQVCAGGSSGFNVAMPVIEDMVYQFSHTTPIGQVNGSVQVEVQGDPSHVTVSPSVPATPVTPSTPATASAPATPTTPSAPSAPSLPVSPSVPATPAPSISPSVQHVAAVASQQSQSAQPTPVIIASSILQPINVQAIDTMVRITCNVDVSIQTMPQVVQAIQRNQLLIPSSLLQSLMSPGTGTGGAGIIFRSR